MTETSWYNAILLTTLSILLGACDYNECPADTDAYWLVDREPRPIRDVDGTPEALVGATVTADGERLVIEYTDPELGPVTVTYRMSNPRRTY